MSNAEQFHHIVITITPEELRKHADILEREYKAARTCCLLPDVRVNLCSNNGLTITLLAAPQLAIKADL